MLLRNNTDEEDTTRNDNATLENEGFLELGDPIPPPPDASSEELSAYKRDVREYSIEALECLKGMGIKGKELWLEFTCSFAAHTFQAMSISQTAAWTRFLSQNGVFIHQERGYARWKALRDCVRAKDFLPSQSAETQGSQETGPRADVQGQAMRPEISAIQPHTQDASRVEHNRYLQTQGRTVTFEGEPRESHTRGYHPLQNNLRGPPAGQQLGHRTTNEFAQYRSGEQISQISGDTGTSAYGRKSAVDSIMKAYGNRQKYSGSFTEDFNGAIEQFETLATICDLSEEDMAKAFPVMLCGSAFSHFTRNFAKKRNTYRELVEAFRSWYTSEEQRYRLLQIWQKPSLRKAMQNAPERSELDVFREVADERTRVQHQLHASYHEDRFLRDQLLVAADIPYVRRSLIEKIPSSAQEAMHRIATLLSSEPRSAGANCANSPVDEVNYGLGQRLGGKARKSLRGSSGRKKENSSLGKRLASVKGCWVCNKNHRARDHHSPQEVIEAINRIKNNNSSILFSAEDIGDIEYAFNSLQGDDEYDEEDSSSDEEDGERVNFLALTDEQELKQEHEAYLANKAFMHGRTFSTDLEKDMRSMNRALQTGETSSFKGIILDTGANRKSAMSLEQYRAYCREFNVPIKIDYSDNRALAGIGGRAQAIGTATIPILFADLDLVIDVNFRILRTNCPSLLSLRDMKENGLDISIQEQVVKFKHKIQELSFENDVLVHKWSPEDTSFAMYTDKELRRLHRVFGHPSVSALRNLLRRANPHEFDKDTRDAIEEITRACETCQRIAAKPRRFKITVGTEELRFNHILAVDVMYLSGRAVLHVVDEATHYPAATFLRSSSAEDTWKALLRTWSRVYLGPPDHLRIDQGSNFVSKRFRDSAEAEGITLLEAPIESPSTMSHVERYHAPLRAAYTKIRDSLPRSETDADCLQLAVKAVNDTIGPEGLCPTLLVYGTLPRPPRRIPAETQLERAQALQAALREVQKEQAKRRIAFALRHPSSPKGVEQEAELAKLPSGSPVLVYREKSKKWEGPFPIVHLDGRTAVVQLPFGRKIFRSTVVKSAVAAAPKENWRVEVDNHAGEPIVNNLTEMDADSLLSASGYPNRCEREQENPSHETIFAMFGDPGEVFNVHMNPTEEHSFIDSMKAELEGLMARETFEIVKRSTVPKGTRVYGTKWVHLLKKVDGKTIEKSRLVAQNFRDKAATGISTKAPTVSRLGQRISIATAAMFPKHTSYTRDISQAYIQSESKLERLVYLEPPKEMGLAEDEVLLAKQPLYGIPESGLHWFVTYHTHHIEALDMNPTKADTFVLYRPGKRKLNGITILQVDDSHGHGNKKFLDDEENASRRFKCKPRKLLREGSSSQFNGSRISIKKQGVHTIDQEEKLLDVKKPNTKEELISTRALLQYVGCCTRPDLCATVQLMATAVTKPEETTFSQMNKVVDWCHRTSSVGLKFVPLDRDSLSLALFTDASFANADRMKSQLGFVVVLTDGHNRGNIIHYGSSRCKRVARSVMAAELHALVFGFDNAYMAKSILTEILGHDIDIDAYVDSRTVFNVVAKNSSTLEKRLQIDVHGLRESHQRGEIRYLAWIPGKQNVADGLTKGLIDATHPLWQLMVTNKLRVDPQGWVEGEKAAQ